MPPKRKAQSLGKVIAAKATKLDEKTTLQKKLSDLRKSDNKIKIHKVDACYPDKSIAKVYEDFDCMLNQTDIKNNNNKFYLIQILEVNNSYLLWTRWGRVGESGQNSVVITSGNINAVIKEFESKYTAKTKNKWVDRDNFVPQTGKYTLIEMADDAEENVSSSSNTLLINKGTEYKPSQLDQPTQNLIEQLFNVNMFKDAMASLNVDVKKMPLGKLSNTQIVKAFEILSELESVIENTTSGDVDQLSSHFYTIIPHNFGRVRPTPIKTLEQLREKFDMLNVLADISLAQNLQSTDKTKAKTKKDNLLPNPIDQNYELLNCKLEYLSPTCAERKILEEYFKNTSSGRSEKVLNIWKVQRQGERERQKCHDKLKRRLLWHGTNMAVVVAILKTGLRIMPHSGGRVGSGIYFASQSSKSLGYAWGPNGRKIMFLNEVAMGKEKQIFNDDSSLKSAPPGFDSVLAMGQIESDEKDAKILNLDGLDVVVPYAKPVKKPYSSSFYESEYLIYKESQNCIRYLLDVQ